MDMGNALPQFCVKRGKKGAEFLSQLFYRKCGIGIARFIIFSLQFFVQPPVPRLKLLKSKFLITAAFKQSLQFKQP